MQGSQVDLEIREVVIDGRGMENDILARCIRYDPDISRRCHNCGLKGRLAFLCLFRLGDPGSPHWLRAILVTSPLFQVRTVFKAIEVIMRRGNLAVGLPAPLVRSITVSIKMANEMAPVALTPPHCLPVLPLVCDCPIHVLLGWPFRCINFALSSPSNNPSCWAHMGSPLLSNWGIKVSLREGKVGLEGVFDPVRSLAQVDTLVDEGGGLSVHLCLCKASPSLFGLLGVGIAFEEVLGVFPIKG